MVFTMIDLSDDMGIEEVFDITSSDVVIDPSQAIYNGSIDGSVDLFENDFNINSETMRLLFITIATISVLACLSICLSVFICVCLNRRRHLKRQEQKDHLLMPEQSEKITHQKVPSIDSSPAGLPATEPSNSRQQIAKKNSSVSIPPSSSATIINMRTPKSYYYDNLDDIPFIDESRPNSYIDITRV